jgi:hypothetical protein
MIENPSQSKVSHADPFGNHSPNFIDRIKRSFKIDAREISEEVASVSVSKSKAISVEIFYANLSSTGRLGPMDRCSSTDTDNFPYSLA